MEFHGIPWRRQRRRRRSAPTHRAAVKVLPRRWVAAPARPPARRLTPITAGGLFHTGGGVGTRALATKQTCSEPRTRSAAGRHSPSACEKTHAVSHEGEVVVGHGQLPAGLRVGDGVLG